MRSQRRLIDGYMCAKLVQETEKQSPLTDACFLLKFLGIEIVRVLEILDSRVQLLLFRDFPVKQYLEMPQNTRISPVNHQFDHHTAMFRYVFAQIRRTACRD